MSPHWTLLLALSFIAFLLVRALLIRYRHDLRKIPGPFLASFSNLDRMWSCAKGNQMNYHITLHAKYGSVVRVGPNHVSVSDGNAISQLYSISSKFVKSEFYSLFDIKTPDGPTSTTFSVRDEAVHKAKKRPVTNAFSMSTMRELEPMGENVERERSALIDLC